MNFRNLGNSDLVVSIAGLGCNNFGSKLDKTSSAAVINTAIEEGINFFDTATMYGDGLSEEYIGDTLGTRRQDIIIASKFGWPGEAPGQQAGGSKHYLYQAIENSLRRLKTDYIDLYQFHRPDPSTPLDETLEAMSDLVRTGKVRYIGTSNFSGWQIGEADWISKSRNQIRCVSAQNEWSLLNRSVESEVIPACDKYKIGMLPYFPLASGFLTGKYKRDMPPAKDSRLANTDYWGNDFVAKITSETNWDALEKLEAFAGEHKHTVHELALSWLASHPVVSSVIAGATNPQQVISNVAATHSWKMEDADFQRLTEAIRNTKSV